MQRTTSLSRLADFIAATATVLLVFPSTAFADDDQPQIDHYRAEVDGMACAFCAQGLEREINDLEATGEPEFELEDGEILIPIVEGKSVSPQSLEELIVDAGYAVRDLHLKATARITQADDEFVAVLARDLRVPIADYDGDEGTFAIEATIQNPGDDPILRITNRE